MNKDLEFLTRVIDEKSAKILDANDKIWEYAELAFHEKILYVSVDRCARSAPAGLCAGVSYEPE